MMVYLDFDLLIEHFGERYRARVLNSPAGQAVIDFSLPFTELELENFLLKFGRPRRGMRFVGSPEMDAAKSFGKRLFEAVFSSQVYGCLRSSIDRAHSQEAGLRLRLRLTETPELIDLPWEYLYNPSLNRFLSLSIETPIVRYLELPESIQPLRVMPPLRILVMISSPYNYAQLNVAQEWKNLKKAVSELENKGLVVLEQMENPTLSALKKHLRKEEYHIFHFIGHGKFDKQNQDGVLILEDEEKRGREVSAHTLGTLLHNRPSLRLAVLNACEGARSSRNDPFAGTAQSLVQQGIPAVIAMQFEITDEAAIKFAHEFYAAIADGYPVDAALVEARTSIFAEGNDIEWGTPVLYMRSPDGQIFDIEHGMKKTSVEPPVLPKPETKTRWSKILAITLTFAFLLSIALVSFFDPNLRQKLFSSKKNVTITTEPMGASVFLNEDLIGKTPIKNYPLSPGTYPIHLEKSDYFSLDTTVVIEKHGSLNFSFRLEPLAKATIVVIPSDARIELDGTLIDASKLTNLQLTVGKHEIKISREGYIPTEAHFDLVQGVNSPIHYQLEKIESAPEFGVLFIISEPSGASIYFDGSRIGKTPLTFENVKVGEHKILLQKEGYEVLSRSVWVKSLKVTSIEEKLIPIVGKLIVRVKPSGATLKIDGNKEIENIKDLFETELPVGSHRVEVAYPPLGKWFKTVEIARNKPHEILIDFNKLVNLTVTAFDTFGQGVRGVIYVDNDSTGITPQKLSLRVGQHTIEVRKKGYVQIEEKKVVNLENDLTEPLKFTLRKIE